MQSNKSPISFVTSTLYVFLLSPSSVVSALLSSIMGVLTHTYTRMGVPNAGTKERFLGYNFVTPLSHRSLPGFLFATLSNYREKVIKICLFWRGTTWVPFTYGWIILWYHWIPCKDWSHGCNENVPNQIYTDCKYFVIQFNSNFSNEEKWLCRGGGGFFTFCPLPLSDCLYCLSVLLEFGVCVKKVFMDPKLLTCLNKSLVRNVIISICNDIFRSSLTVRINFGCILQ